MVHQGVIWIILSGNVLVFSTIDNQEIICPCLFTIIFSSNVLIFQRVLAFVIEKKIVLVSDACFRFPISIRSHDLCAGDIRGAVGEIASYHEKD
jgi:hypothetical protein